ncbi:GntR family transcriptional regulator [Streptomyces sp. 4N509B]
MSKTIHRSRLADQAYELIKDRILSRQLLPGQRLSVPALAQELNLSRSPIREAVQRLVQEGLSTERPHQGAVVASADLSALVDLYQVRAELEGLSAELAATRGDAELAASLERIHADHRTAYETNAAAEVIRADTAFHARVLAASGNPELVRILQPVLQRMSLAMVAGGESWPAHALTEHQAVLDAIRAGDGALARARMTDHVARVRERLLSRLHEEES